MMTKRVCGMILAAVLMVAPAFAAEQHTAAPAAKNTAAPAAQDSAVQAVKTHLEKVIAVLSDPALKGEAGKQAKIEKVSAISEQLFDFIELSKRSLGGYWRRFTPKQQTEFAELYKKLLKKRIFKKTLFFVV